MTNTDKLSALLLLIVFVAIIHTYSIILEINSETQERIKNIRVMVEHLEAENKALTERRDALEANIDRLRGEREQRQEEILEMMENWLDTFEIKEMETTMYAPLDPDAIPGMCFSGNPNITASGAQVVPGVTVAAGPSIPFGTRMFIDGHGWRTVQDRGSRITDRHIDIAVSSRQEALQHGRQPGVLVVVQR